MLIVNACWLTYFNVKTISIVSNVERNRYLCLLQQRFKINFVEEEKGKKTIEYLVVRIYTFEGFRYFSSLTI